jgi:hypothetical protein
MQMSAYCMENRSLFACKRQLAIVEIKIEMYQILSYELILLNGLLAAGMIVHMHINSYMKISYTFQFLFLPV